MWGDDRIAIWRGDFELFLWKGRGHLGTCCGDFDRGFRCGGECLRIERTGACGVRLWWGDCWEIRRGWPD